MIEVDVPGFGELRLAHLVCDYNGTLAQDGALLAGVAHALREIARDLEVHVVTADTFGCAADELVGLPLRLTVLHAEEQASAKLAHVIRLGAERVVAVGNGRNDAQMLEAARLGIALVQGEGAAVSAVVSADIVVGGIIDALTLLREPRRLLATLRS